VVLARAMEVARQGEGADPPEPAPAPIRPFLSFAKLPARALSVTRRVLDEDPAFRERVREAVSEDVVGRAGWLFVERPEGWHEELTALMTDADAQAGRDADERAGRAARRRAERADESVRRAEGAAETAQRDAAEGRAQLAAERQARRTVESEAGRLRQRLQRLEDELAAARREVREADSARVAALAAGEAALEEATTMRTELERLQASLEDARARTAPSHDDPEPGGGIDVKALSEALAQASAALSAAARALGGAETRPGEPPAPTPSAAVPRPHRRRARAPLPPGIREDSREAGDALVHVAGLVVLVDGYNVSLLGWPDRPLAEQRERLVDGLTALAARTGIEAHVVFDGTEESARTITAEPRSNVRLTFTPDQVEADDVLLDALDAIPIGRPVAVATNDRKVREEARRRGANLLSSNQLLDLLRG